MMIDDDGINRIPLKVYFHSDSPGELASGNSVANMMDEELIKLEARLGAIEVAICDLAAICYITGGGQMHISSSDTIFGANSHAYLQLKD